jgi:hypothetical protein
MTEGKLQMLITNKPNIKNKQAQHYQITVTQWKNTASTHK